MKTAILLSVRNKSTRFPEKVLKIIKGQTVTENLIDRLKLAKGYDRIVIATSNDERDKVFKKIALNKKVDIFYGDKKDKLKRYLQIVRYFDLDAVTIVDGDDLLCFPEIVTKTIEILNEGENDLVMWKNLPLGAASFGLTKNALERVMEMKDEEDTEVWGGYFTNGDFKVKWANSDITLFNNPHVRLTLDYKEDYDFLVKVFDQLFPLNKKFSSMELMDLLINKKPEFLNINSQAQSKYEEHIKKAAPVKFKQKRG